MDHDVIIEMLHRVQADLTVLRTDMAAVKAELLSPHPPLPGEAEASYAELILAMADINRLFGEIEVLRRPGGV